MFVLIDTWWNVNMRAIYLPTDQRIVLIDTWWNVNYIKTVEGNTSDAF